MNNKYRLRWLNQNCLYKLTLCSVQFVSGWEVIMSNDFGSEVKQLKAKSFDDAKLEVESLLLDNVKAHNSVYKGTELFSKAKAGFVAKNRLKEPLKNSEYVSLTNWLHEQGTLNDLDDEEFIERFSE